MFDFIRTHQRLMQLVLLLLIVPSFVFFGIQGYERMSQNNRDVAKVGGQPITQGELDSAQREQLNRMQQQLGQGFDASMLDTPEARAQTLEGLIAQRVLANHVAQQHLGASPQQLRDTIASVPALQENGRFSADRYRAFLAQQGMTDLMFESRLGQDLAIRQISTAIEGSAIVPKKVVERFVALASQRRDAATATFKAAEYAARVKLADDAVQKEYDTHPEAYSIPESIKVEYVALGADALAKQVTVPEQDVREFYEKNRSRYEVPEQRRASHILVAVNKDASDADKAKAKAKAEDLLKKVRANPADFAKIAKQSSDDPGSAANGGDLDYLGRGATVPPFEAALFSLKPDVVSDLVQSDFGFHIIKVTDIKPQQVRPFDAVRPEIEAELKKQLAQKKFTEAAESFANSVYEQGDSLAPTAKTFGLTVMTADHVTRLPGTGVDPSSPLANTKLLNALFSADSLKNKHNVEAIETSPGTLVSARVLDFTPASKRPLVEVQGEIRKRLVDIEARKLAEDAGKAAVVGLRAGKPTAAAFGPDRSIARLEPSEIPQNAVVEIFRTDASKLPAYAGASLASGDYAVYRIDGVTAGPPDPPDRVRGLAQSIERQSGSLEFSGYLEDLRKRSKVRVYPPYAELVDRKAPGAGT